MIAQGHELLGPDCLKRPVRKQEHVVLTLGGHVHVGGVSGLPARHTQPLHDSRRIFATSPSWTTPSNASRNTVYTERTDEPAARGPRT